MLILQGDVLCEKKCKMSFNEQDNLVSLSWWVVEISLSHQSTVRGTLTSWCTILVIQWEWTLTLPLTASHTNQCRASLSVTCRRRWEDIAISWKLFVSVYEAEGASAHHNWRHGTLTKRRSWTLREWECVAFSRCAFFWHQRLSTAVHYVGSLTVHQTAYPNWGAWRPPCTVGITFWINTLKGKWFHICKISEEHALYTT